MVRVKKTEKEKVLDAYVGKPVEGVNMQESEIDDVIDSEKSNSCNSMIDKFEEDLQSKGKAFAETIDKITVEHAEIKPMFNRLLIQPFKTNPFQKFEMKNGIIVDAGGYTPHTQLNPVTGRYEEQKEFIVTGVVIEVGPDVKYLIEGDVVYYRVDTACPVPFFKQGLVSLAESQIIAVVNEGLESRFNSIKGI